MSSLRNNNVRADIFLIVALAMFVLGLAIPVAADASVSAVEPTRTVLEAKAFDGPIMLSSGRH